MSCLNRGHYLIFASLMLLVLGSHILFFSMFLPNTGIIVRMSQIPDHMTSKIISVSRYAGSRQTLQILVCYVNSDDDVLCHRKLGRMAILSKFIECFNRYATKYNVTVQAAKTTSAKSLSMSQ